MVYILFADGFEEIEGLTVVDLLRRARIDISTVSITDSPEVTTSHGITLKTDIILKDMPSDMEMLVLPGGLKGVNNLKASRAVADIIREQYEKGAFLAAVCAGPTVFGEMGLLKDVKATCYPGLEAQLIGAVKADGETVIRDGQFITSRALGTSIDFAAKIIETLKDRALAEEIASQVVYSHLYS